MKTLIKILAITVTFIGATSCFAQQGPPRDRIKTLKVAYLTDELQLTSKEAQAFWPIYNDHESKMEEIRRKERMLFGKRTRGFSEISEEDAIELLTSVLLLRKEKQQIEDQFVSDLKRVIPSKKILTLFKAEEGFKRRLLEQFRNKRGPR